ncbi:MAG: 50S ribosomal protein L28 [Pseudomonadota bacterium]
MSRICELSGVGVMSGHKVSHSERKTNRKFLPNLRRATLVSDSLGSSHRFRVIARVLKSIEMHGGLDGFLLKAKDCCLSKSAIDLKKRIKTALTK